MRQARDTCVQGPLDYQSGRGTRQLDVPSIKPLHALTLYSVFFFQAEDGIRDLTVTGVQTCALPIFSVKNLVKTYVVGEVEVRALRGVNLDVERGEFLAVTGPSGSGKSTFMHIAGCLDRPTSGQYFLDGDDVSKMSRDQLAAVRNHKI